MEKKQIVIGDKAPDFILDGHNEKPFKLSDFKGKKVLLSFHPLAWTSVCAKQMISLEENKKQFDKLFTTIVGVSVDTAPSKKAWAKALGIKKTRLLSDFWPHGKVAQLYGIFREDDGISERANIIIDEKQTISFVKIYHLREFAGGVVIGSLEAGNIVTVLECIGDWCKVQTVEHLGYVWRGCLSGHEDLGCEAR